MSFNTKNYTEQGGARTVIGGELVIRDEAVISGMAQIRQYKWSAEEAVAADDDGIVSGVVLGEVALEVTAGFGDLPCARNVVLTPGTNMGTAKKVIVHGRDISGDEIVEELTFNGSNAVTGSKAFAGVTKLVLPIREHTPAYQTETLAVLTGATLAGTVTVTLTAAGVTGSPVSVTSEVEASDDVAAVAAKIASALNADEAIAAKYTATSVEGVVTLAANKYAANDTTLALVFTDTDSTSATATGSNGTDGVAQDTIILGWGDKLGLPKLFANGVYPLTTYLGGVAESNAPTIVTSGTALCSNTLDLSSTLNGSIVETLLVVR